MLSCDGGLLVVLSGRAGGGRIAEGRGFVRESGGYEKRLGLLYIVIQGKVT